MLTITWNKGRAEESYTCSEIKLEKNSILMFRGEELIRTITPTENDVFVIE